MFSDHPFDLEPDDSSRYVLTVRVTAPGDVAALVQHKLWSVSTYARLEEEDWGAGTMPLRPRDVSVLAFAHRIRGLARVILCFEADFATGVGGVFRNLTPAQVQDTFHSYRDAMGVWVEDSARFDAEAWQAMAEALPTYPQLRRLELHGVTMPSEEVGRIRNAAAACPRLEGMSFGVDWDGIIPGDYEITPCARLTSTAIAGFAAQTMADAPRWLCRSPRLRRLKLGLTATDDLAVIYDGLKRALRNMHAIPQMEYVEVVVLYNPPWRRDTATVERCALLNPAVPCAMRLRAEDYAYAQAFPASQPMYTTTQGEEWTSATLGPGIFAALRHRQWTRYAVLHSFLEATRRRCQGSRETEVAAREARNVEVLRQLPGLPQDIWCRVLEAWLGGRITVGSRRGGGAAGSSSSLSSTAVPSPPGGLHPA